MTDVSGGEAADGAATRRADSGRTAEGRADGGQTAEGRADGGQTAEVRGNRRERARGTGGYVTLVRALARKRLALLVRYPVNTVSNVAMLFVFFALVFFGGRAVAGQALTDSTEGIVVGFFLYALATTGFSGVALSVARESQWGTLEQLFMSPFGYGRMTVLSVALGIAESFLWGAVALAFMVAVSGATLFFDVVTILVVGVFAVAPAVGLGFAFGGLALVFKRVENLFDMMTIGFVALIAAPNSGVFAARLLPVSQGSYLLTRAMRDGIRLWEFPAVDLALLVGTAVVYFAAGYGILQRLSRRARELGVMGHY